MVDISLKGLFVNSMPCVDSTWKQPHSDADSCCLLKSQLRLPVQGVVREGLLSEWVDEVLWWHRKPVMKRQVAVLLSGPNLVLPWWHHLKSVQ